MGKKYNIGVAPTPDYNYFTITGAEAFTNIILTDATGRSVKQLVKQPGNGYT